MNEYIEHICAEVGIPPMSRRKMVQYGICTLSSLKHIKERSQNGELDDLREEIIKKLLIIAGWVENNPDANVFEEFDEDVYQKLYRNHKWVKKYIKYALGRPRGEDNALLYKDVDEDTMGLVLNKSIGMIMESPHLRKKLGKFDYKIFLEKAIRHFHTLVGEECVSEKKFIIAGRTQSGKSAVKGVVQSLCGLLNIPLIILTKGVDESIDLHGKLVDLSEGTLIQEKHIVVASSKNDRMGYKMKNAKIEEAFEGTTHGGTLVIADTAPQVLNKACKAIVEWYRKKNPDGHFILIIDEADAMIRTKDKHQLFERALEELRDLKATIEIDFAATPVPVMLELIYGRTGDSEHKVLEKDIEFFNLEPTENYVGMEDIKPLEVNGKKVFLVQNELSKSSVFISAEGISVCYANNKNIDLYEDAMRGVPVYADTIEGVDQDTMEDVPDLIGGAECTPIQKKPRKGILVLDCCCPRVYVDHNIQDKANGVQKLYRKRGKLLIVITFSGSGIYVKFPVEIDPIDSQSIDDEQSEEESSESIDDEQSEGKSGEWRKWHNSVIGTLLQYIDDKCGLVVPVLIVAYTKMCRGISFRSDGRVPTHMLMSLGRGHNASTIVQTLGRSTFNGKQILNANGFDSVTVLATANDYTMCHKMQAYIDTIYERIQLGDTFAEAVTGANEKIPDSANFWRHTFREVGRIKGMNKKLHENVDVEDAPLELDYGEEELRDEFWDDTDAQKLLRSLARLRKSHPLVEMNDIVDDLEETGYHMAKKKLRELLNICRDNALVSKAEKWTQSRLQYRLPRVRRLVLFMNPEKGEVPGIKGDELEVPDIEGDGQSVGSKSNLSELASLGSKESPILLLDSDDESSISSLTVSTVGKKRNVYPVTETSTRRRVSNTKRRRRSTAKLVSPEKEHDIIKSKPRSYVGRRIAKLVKSKLYFGLVFEYHEDGECWYVNYDDGDGQDLNKDELDDALRLYTKHRASDHSKPSSIETEASV